MTKHRIILRSGADTKLIEYESDSFEKSCEFAAITAKVLHMRVWSVELIVERRSKHETH